MVTPILPIDLYVRVSDQGSRTEETGFGSPQIQVATAKSHLYERGFTIGLELPHDINRSGGNMDRPGLNLALERIRNKQSGGIAIAYQSRYARNVILGLQTLDEIVSAGGGIYGPGLPDYLTPEGRYAFINQLNMDELYRNRARVNAHLSRQRAVEQGFCPYKWVAIGYSKQQRKLVPNKDAVYVTQAFHLKVDYNLGPTEISDFLNDHGVLTSHGGQITRSVVHTMLSNPVYLGEMHYHPDLPEDEHRINRNSHQALIDPSTFYAAQAKGTKPRSTGHTKTPLKGILRCGSCGYTLVQTNNGAGTNFYRCTGQTAQGKCDRRAYVLSSKIHADVESMFFSILPELQVQKFSDADDTQELETQYAKAIKRFEQNQSNEVRDALGDDWAKETKRLRDERDSLANELAKRKSASLDTDRKLLLDTTLAKAYPNMTVTQKNHVLRSLFAKVIVTPEPGRKYDLAFVLNPNVEFDCSALTHSLVVESVKINDHLMQAVVENI